MNNTPALNPVVESFWTDSDSSKGRKKEMLIIKISDIGKLKVKINNKYELGRRLQKKGAKNCQYYHVGLSHEIMGDGCEVTKR